MAKKLAIGVVASVALLAVMPVMAADNGVYIGAGLGYSFPSGLTNETAYNIFGGYTFNKYLSAEAAYFQSDGSGTTLGSTKYDISASGVSAEAVGHLPIGKSFEFFGKLGLASYNQKSISGSGSGQALAYGAGFSVSLVKQFALGLEYEGINVATDDYNSLLIRATFKF